MRLFCRPSAALFGAAVLLVVASAPVASAQNLVVNPHFDTGITSWDFTGPTGSFDPTRDANGSPSSGAGQISTTVPGIFQTFRQCITGITPGTSYDFGGKVFVVSNPQGGSVALGVAFFTSADCSSGPLTNAVSNVVSTTGSWQDATGSIVAPAGAVSAFVLTGVNPGPGPGVTDVVADIDEMFFQAAGAVPTVPTAMLTLLGIGLAFVAYRRIERRRQA